MKTTQKIKKQNHILIAIAGIGVMFSGVFIIQAANEGKLYDAIYNDKISQSTQLTKKIHKIYQTFEAERAFKEQEYEKALEYISGTKSEDYYNRGTIQTLLAYQNALENNISGLETAKKFISQAQQNFDIAYKLGPSSKIHEAIEENQTTIDILFPVIEIKTCYGLGQNIINSLRDINTDIIHIQKTLQQEEEYINKKSTTLNKACYEKLQYIVNTSKTQIASLHKEIEYKKNIYHSDLSHKIKNPEICLQVPYENILPSLIKGKKGLESYTLIHQNIIDVLKNNNKQKIQELCEQTKNDAQVNQEIEDAVQEMLQKLEENTTEQQEHIKNIQNKQYKDIFNQNEETLLKEIQQINKSRINYILEIRGKGNYEPQRHINNIFNQFYGNPDDFIDLRK